MLQNLFIDRLSFWIGFFSGMLFVWFLARLRTALPRLIRFSKERLHKARENMEAGTEIRFRRDVLRHAQKQHLAAPLFSLEEILIQPFLQVPPIQAHTVSEWENQDHLHKALPYLPDWPEFRASFSGPVFSLTDALQKKSNLLLMGYPGSGKTTALCHLAGLLAQKNPEAGALSSLLPIPVHAADLNLQGPDQADPLLILQDCLSAFVSPITMTRLGNLLRPVMQSGTCLIIVDGIDELPPDEIEQIREFLSQLLEKYPKIRLVAAAAPDYYDGLTALGLFPVSMASWTNQQMAAFIHQWGEMWDRHVKEEGLDDVDSYLLENWLSGGDCFTTPLEKTLNIWAAFAGDVLGPDPHDSIKAHMRRVTVTSARALPALEKIASSAIKEMKTVFTFKDAEKWIQESTLLDKTSQEVLLPEEDETEKEEIETLDAPFPADDKKPPTRAGLKEALLSERLVSDSIQTGLIVERKNGRLSFVHPVFAAFLAAAGFTEDGGVEQLLEQREWSGKLLTLQFLSSTTDITHLALPILDDNTDPVLRRQNDAWRCLRYSTKDSRWRSTAMKKLASVIQDPASVTGIRLRAVSALASSRDPGVNVLFRKLLHHNNSSVRKTSAMGCGLIKDSKAVPELSTLIDDPSPDVGRAAILALNAIGTTAAIEEIKNALFTGSEEMSRAAAEALSVHEEAGHPTLEQGSQMEDPSVRKAVVFGLARVNKPWARNILETMQIEDGQWLVRNAASEILEELSKPDLHIPQPMPILTEAPWLITFAGKLGIGVAPGRPAFNLVLQALEKGEPYEQLAALDYLKIYGSPDAAPGIYEILYGSDGELEEAAYDTLWSMTSSGIPLPSPVQYGMGD